MKMNSAYRGEIVKDILFTLLTCSLYNIYAQYQYGLALVDVQREAGGKVNDSLPWLALILNIFGLGIVMMAIEQDEINQLCA